MTAGRRRLPTSAFSSFSRRSLATSAATLRRPLPDEPEVPEPDPPRSPSAVERACHRVLRACGPRSLREGVCVHSPIIKLNLLHDTYLTNSLLSLCWKSGGADRARKLFDELEHRDVVSWTSMMSAYAGEGAFPGEAVRLFRLMLASGLRPNEFTFSVILRWCASSLMEFSLGACLHAMLLKFGFACDAVLGSALMDFYSRSGMLREAVGAFGAVGSGDTVSWTTMMSVLLRFEEWRDAWDLYTEMAACSVPPNEVTFTNLLVACASLGIMFGKVVHAHVVLWGVELNLVLKTALVNMYARCHHMGDALDVFNQTMESDVTLWTAIISGHNQVDDSAKAIAAFHDMVYLGIEPNAFTYAGILSACSSTPIPNLGLQVHSQVVKSGLDHNVSVGNALMDMYMKCFSDINVIKFLFKRIISPNVVSWTIMITALGENQQDQEAYLAFTAMQVDGLQPNVHTVSSILKVCRSVESLVFVRKLHSYILKAKLGPPGDIIVSNSLVDAYSSLGDIHTAWEVFNKMPHRDAITYTSLIKGLNQMGFHVTALGMISQMRDEGFDMDSFSLPCFLSASAGLAAVEPGKQLHCYSMKSGLDFHISVSNGLIDMYGKCGSICEAVAVFSKAREPNVVSWNNLIFALASNSHFSDALSAFEDMRMAGIQPDDITFVLVLYACSHAGLVELGLDHFNSMKNVYSIYPQLDHYVCLVDLLGRSGRLEEAVHTVDTMPYKPDTLVYKTLLSSCKLHRNLYLGEAIARHALALDPSDPSLYVMLSNMYEDAGELEYARQTRRMMRERGVVKCPGQSWIELRSTIYLFRAGDVSNPSINDIHKKLENLEVAKGMARTRDHCNVRKVTSLHHSEKLALAFGLLNSPPSAPIRIIKNLRICEDCHHFMEHSSKLTGREIIVRDVSRFHLFKAGSCSCRGYW